MSTFQGVAISEAPLLLWAVLYTLLTAAVAVFLIATVVQIVKGKMAKRRAPKWLDALIHAVLLGFPLTILIIAGVEGGRHWLDYAKKDYCVYTGSYEVKEVVNRVSRGPDTVSYVAVLPDGHRVDISLGNVGYTTGTLVYTARTNILLGYDDSIVITPEE